MVAPWDRRDERERARIEAAQLQRWLPTVVAATPFHAQRLGPLDRRPGDRAGLQRLTPTRERDLLADGTAGASAVLQPTGAQVAAGADQRVITTIARSIRSDGAGGERDAIAREYRPLQLHRGGVRGQLLVASTRSDLDRMHRTGARAAAVLDLRDDDVVVSLVPAGPTLDHLGVVHLAAGAGLTALHDRGAAHDLSAAVAALALVAPSVLVVPVDEVEAVAAEVRAQRRTVRHLRLVVVVGPPPGPDERGRVAAAFGGGDIEVRSLWGPSAGRTLWAECADPAGGLHTYPDLEVLEVVDPLTAAPTDGDGDLTVTSLGWHGTAHVRFRTGTWVDPLATDPCPGCGRTVPRVVGELVPHAWELPIHLGAGRHGSVDLRGVGTVTGPLAWVGTWRAEVVGPAGAGDDRDRLVVEVTGRGSPDEVAELERSLQVATGAVTQVNLVGDDAEVARLTEEAGGVLADHR